MAQTFKIQFEGFKELSKIFSEFPEEVQKKAGADALKFGAKPMLEEAKKNVPVRTGGLRDSLMIREVNKRGKLIVVKIVASRSKGKKGFHAHLVELGTKPHTIKNAVIGSKKYAEVQHPGQVKNPFMRPAFLTKKEETIKKTFEVILDKAAKRLKKLK